MHREEPLVFVYGTLMRARSNHRVLVELGARFVAEATTLEPREIVDLGPYPAMRDVRSGVTLVAGELWALPSNDSLAQLDAFEGTQYRRERVLLRTAESEIEAYVYVLSSS